MWINRTFVHILLHINDAVTDLLLSLKILLSTSCIHVRSQLKSSRFFGSRKTASSILICCLGGTSCWSFWNEGFVFLGMATRQPATHRPAGPNIFGGSGSSFANRALPLERKSKGNPLFEQYFPKPNPLNSMPPEKDECIENQNEPVEELKSSVLYHCTKERLQH